MTSFGTAIRLHQSPPLHSMVFPPPSGSSANSKAPISALFEKMLHPNTSTKHPSSSFYPVRETRLATKVIPIEFSWPNDINPFENARHLNTLLEDALEYTLDELSSLAEQNKIQFNRSSALLNHPEFLHAIYRFMTLLLIEHAAVKNSTHGPELSLNSRIHLSASRCFKAAESSKKSSLVFVPPTPLMTTTPPPTLTFGVDPVGLRRMFETLLEEEKEAVRWKLLSPFIPESAQSLIKATNSTHLDVRLTLNLLQDLALALFTSYHNALKEIFDKHLDPSIHQLPIDKTTPPPPEELAPGTCPWICRIDESLNAIFPQFSDSQLKWETLWRANRAGVIPPDSLAIDLFERVQAQFYYGVKEPLFKALFRAITGNEIADKQETAFRKLLAEYLATSPITMRLDAGHPFCNKDQALDLEKYRQWLIAPAASDYRADEMELQLLSKILGVRMGCFIDGGTFNICDTGLLWPGISWGPATSTTILLFKHENGLYSALAPKWTFTDPCPVTFERRDDYGDDDGDWTLA